MSEFQPFFPEEKEEEPVPRFNPPIENFWDNPYAVLAHKGKYFSEEELAALQVGWTDPHERNRYIEMFLNKLRGVYTTRDGEGIKAALEALGAIITSAIPFRSGQESKSMGADCKNGSWRILLVGGTSGQRVLLKDGSLELLGRGLFFSLEGEPRVSDLPLRGLANLFGDQLKHIPHQHDDSESVFFSD